MAIPRPDQKALDLTVLHYFIIERILGISGKRPAALREDLVQPEFFRLPGEGDPRRKSIGADHTGNFYRRHHRGVQQRLHHAAKSRPTFTRRWFVVLYSDQSGRMNFPSTSLRSFLARRGDSSSFVRLGLRSRSKSPMWKSISPKRCVPKMYRSFSLEEGRLV